MDALGPHFLARLLSRSPEFLAEEALGLEFLVGATCTRSSVPSWLSIEDAQVSKTSASFEVALLSQGCQLVKDVWGLEFLLVMNILRLEFLLG